MSHYRLESYARLPADTALPLPTRIDHAASVAWSGWRACPASEAQWFLPEYLSHGSGALGRSNQRCLHREFADLEGIVWAEVTGSHGFSCIIVDERYSQHRSPEDFPRPAQWVWVGGGDESADDEWLARLREFAESIDALSDYPCWDEDDLSELESEEEAEAWERDGYADVAREVRETFGEEFEEFTTDHARLLVADYVFGDQTGGECHHEQNGAWIDAEYVVKNHVSEHECREVMGRKIAAE